MELLLRTIDLITRQRDRTHLDAVLINALHELSGAESVRLYKLQWVKAEPMVGLAAEFSSGELRQHDDGISGPEGSLPVAQYAELASVLDGRVITRQLDRSTGLWHYHFLIGMRKQLPTGFIAMSGLPILSDELEKIVLH